MRRLLALSLTAALPLSFSGCGGSSPTSSVDDGANTNPLCSPVAAGHCASPFPSSFYMKADSTSPTGFRVNVPKGAFPKNQVGEDYDPVRLNMLPGWSLSTNPIVDLGAGVRVDSSKFVGERGNYDDSMKAESQTQIIELPSGARVPHFAEVDANAVADTDTQMVILHPMVRLKPATRYVVALQKLVDKKGGAVVVKPFRSLVDGKLADGSRLQDVKARYDEIFAATDKAGIARADLTYAWDFVTGTDEQSYMNVLTMRDQAFKRWKEQNLGYTVTSSMDVTGDDLRIRTIEGDFDVPSFLVDPTDRYSLQNMDASGKPLDTGKNFTAHFLINVPKCAETATGPLPILIYGHGNFGSRVEINGGDDKLVMNTLCMVEMATDWVGQADGDEAAFAAKAASFDKVAFLFDRMQQGQLNTLLFARLAKQKFPTMKELEYNGKPLVDGKEIYYYGNSQGGIYGNTFMAYSPDVQKGVLGVGAVNYSIMIWRSRDFDAEKQVMDYLYEDIADQQILWMAAQNSWDHVDPMGMVAHSILDPLPDETGAKMQPKQILLMEGIYDAQVPNVATRLGARIMGLPLLDPAVQDVWGVEKKAGPLDSAYTQWDFHAEPPLPTTNSPKDKVDAKGEEPVGSTGESVHEAVRRQPEGIEMIRRFLKPGGKVENTCNGACDFPKKP